MWRVEVLDTRTSAAVDEQQTTHLVVDVAEVYQRSSNGCLSDRKLNPKLVCCPISKRVEEKRLIVIQGDLREFTVTRILDEVQVGVAHRATCIGKFWGSLPVRAGVEDIMSTIRLEGNAKGMHPVADVALVKDVSLAKLQGQLWHDSIISIHSIVAGFSSEKVQLEVESRCICGEFSSLSSTLGTFRRARPLPLHGVCKGALQSAH